MKKKHLGYTSILISALFIAGCGSNDKVDGNIVTNGDAGMSITPVGVSYDVAKGCEMLFRAHAVEGNGNPIVGLGVGANVVVNAKVSGTNIGLIQTTTPITFVDNRLNFNTKKIVQNDNLIIIPSINHHDTSYIGDWKIYSVNGSEVTLSGAAYNLETTDQLSYVIGSESVYVAGTTAVAHIEKVDDNGTSSTNDKGYAYFNLIYDTELVGQPYMVGAHTGDGYRMGAAWSGQFPNCIETPEDNITTPPDTNTTGSTTSCGATGSTSCPSKS
jgi:hypothetical protein